MTPREAVEVIRRAAALAKALRELPYEHSEDENGSLTVTVDREKFYAVLEMTRMPQQVTEYIIGLSSDLCVMREALYEKRAQAKSLQARIDKLHAAWQAVNGEG